LKGGKWDREAVDSTLWKGGKKGGENAAEHFYHKCFLEDGREIGTCPGCGWCGPRKKKRKGGGEANVLSLPSVTRGREKRSRGNKKKRKREKERP